MRGERVDPDGRFPRRLRPVAERRHRDNTRIAARRAVRRDGNVTEFESGKFTPCKSEPGKPPLWCISAARIVHDHDGPDHHLPGCPVRVVRRAGPVLSLLPASRSVGETPVRLPAAWRSATPPASASRSRCRTISPSPQLRLHLPPDVHLQAGRPLAGRLAPQVRQRSLRLHRDSTRQARGDRPERHRREARPQGPAEQLARQRGDPRPFNLSSWWGLGWDVTLESDDTFRRFYKLDNRLLTDRVNTIYLPASATATISA